MTKENDSFSLVALVTILVVLMSVSLNVRAFTLTPMVSTIDLMQGNTTEKFVVNNESDEVIAIEISIHQRKMHADGSEELVLEEDKFVLYPEQIILKPNDSRTVKLQWIGGSPGSSELPFRLVAEQLPINIKENDSSASGISIEVLQKYIASVYVDPGQTKPSLKISKFSYDLDRSELSLNMSNDGSKHIVPRDSMSLSLVDKSGDVIDVLSGKIIKALWATNYLPGSERNFLLSLPKDMKVDALSKIKLEYGEQ